VTGEEKNANLSQVTDKFRTYICIRYTSSQIEIKITTLRMTGVMM